jgi:pimeloyl-ACP methyl ester carboxylesterase
MIRAIGVVAALVGAIVLFGPCAPANAQNEIPPPQGKGPVVVVVSGQLGALHYMPPAQQIAALGYDVVLLDGNSMEGSHGQTLLAAVRQAQSAPHGLPGKVAVVGFSLGGGEALFYASRWPDTVSVIVAWYPLTRPIRDPTSFVGGIKVPILMFAGELDHYHDCCLIATARGLAAAASAQGAPLEVVTYPNTEHDFIFGGRDYNAAAASDSWQRATAKLAQYLGH